MVLIAQEIASALVRTSIKTYFFFPPEIPLGTEFIDVKMIDDKDTCSI